MFISNPFSPTSPIKPGMFAGRNNEIETLKRIMSHTKVDKGHGALLLGERGIGKTSLLMLTRFLAEGMLKDDDKFNFLVIELDIDKTTSQELLIRKINMALRRKLAKTEPTRKLFENLWSFIGRVEVCGTKVNTDRIVDQELIFDEFCYSFADTLKRITKSSNEFGPKYDGCLIIVDEADNSNKDLNLGNFVKLLYERIQREGTQQLMITLAGLPNTKQLLLDSHPSSIRIFEELNLDRLDRKDIQFVLDRVLEHSEVVNGFKTFINNDARDLLEYLSEGYPNFIHQYGYCAFEISDKNTITKNDVLDGAFGNNGAIEKIGSQYYIDDYYNKIRVDSYRQVLDIMAEKYDQWVTKKYISDKFKGDKSVLNNAIKALRTRGVILDKEGSIGKYRLRDKGFAWWIKLKKEKYRPEK